MKIAFMNLLSNEKPTFIVITMDSWIHNIFPERILTSLGGKNTTYSLSSERLVNIKITKFYAEKVLPRVNDLFIYLQAVTLFAMKLCSN
jgi:hypothetical protein